MAVVTTIFRTQTSTSIQDLMDDEGLQCMPSHSLLCYLAGALLNYREEERELAPVVILCDDANALIKSFPGSTGYWLGNASPEADFGKRILKECAPLAAGNWHLFIERKSNGTFDYGIFSYPSLPTTLPLFDVITLSPLQLCVLLQKVGPQAVEIRGAHGSVLTLLFSTVREANQQDGSIGEFAEYCCVDLTAGADTEMFRIYLQHLLTRCVSRSHGTILACSTLQDLQSARELKDHVPLTPKLDFYAAFLEYRSAATAEAFQRMQNYEELLSGLMASDGIVCLDTSGGVIAYRAFYTQRTTTKVKAAVLSGGARRRAFEGSKQLVPRVLKALLFRSQDGQMLVHGEKNV
jgi:hypothetical protein